MLWRMVYCLRHGEALDQDVYDAAGLVVDRAAEREIDRRPQPAGRRARFHARPLEDREAAGQSLVNEAQGRPFFLPAA